MVKRRKSPRLVTEVIYHADCISVLPRVDGLGRIPDESIDLVYLDPPFFSGKNYDIVWDNGAELESYTRRPADADTSQAFADDTMYWSSQTPDSVQITAFVNELVEQGIIDIKDRDEAILKRASATRGRIGKGAIHGYLAYMAPRLRAIHRVLKPTGSVYLHCDKHANAHLRIMMDEIFGVKRFRNEIIWHKRGGIKAITKFFPHKKDTILFYTKSDDYAFHVLRGPIEENALYSRWIKYSKDGETVLFEDFPRTDKVKFKDYVRRFKSRHKRNPENGDVLYRFEGAIIDSVWSNIADIYRGQVERLGYPTQKPEALVERIILASSNEGDVVLDPFAGGGTTLAVARRLGRRWIGIDVSPRACDTMRGRLKALGARVPRRITVAYDPRVEQRLEMTLRMLEEQDWKATEEWVRQELGFVKNRTSERYGIDGIKGKKFLEVKDWSGPVGKPVVEKLAGEMVRRGATEGVIVGHEFSSGVDLAVRDLKKRGLHIEIVYFSELAGKTIQATLAH